MMKSNPISDQSESLGFAIGRRVHMLMWERRMTQSALAAKIGLDQPGVGRRLRGETGWSTDELAATAHELDTTVAYLFGEVDDAQWAPSGSNRRPADYKYVASKVLQTAPERHKLAPVVPIERAFEIRAQRDENVA
jgi:transcriptional regulator with XRE-family HTH domain